MIWLGWAIVLLSFQAFMQMRLDLKRPDEVLGWTAQETQLFSNLSKPYLVEPFLNDQVAWDSEYYLAIAAEGYDSGSVTAIPDDFGWDDQHRQFCTANPEEGCYALSYAFFPVYPFLTRLMAYPLKVFKITEIARYTLAAVIVSLLATLLAMVSLYYLSRKSLGEESAVRAVFYFLIFPSSFFLAQVYTEGVFIGITFACLAFLSERKRGWAAFFGALAVWARPGGALLLLPFIIIFFQDKPWNSSCKQTIFQGLIEGKPFENFHLRTFRWYYFETEYRKRRTCCRSFTIRVRYRNLTYC